MNFPSSRPAGSHSLEGSSTDISLQSLISPSRCTLPQLPGSPHLIPRHCAELRWSTQPEPRMRLCLWASSKLPVGRCSAKGQFCCINWVFSPAGRILLLINCLCCLLAVSEETVSVALSQISNISGVGGEPDVVGINQWESLRSACLLGFCVSWLDKNNLPAVFWRSRCSAGNVGLTEGWGRSDAYLM